MTVRQGLILFYVAATLAMVACGVAGAVHGDWVTPAFAVVVAGCCALMMRELRSDR